MTSSSSRDRISVDLRGLRAALFEQARAMGVRPSDVVRESLAASLTARQDRIAEPPKKASKTTRGGRGRLTLRMSRKDVESATQAARFAGLPVGEYVAGLIAGALPPMSGLDRRGVRAELSRSSAELSTLARNIRQLTRLLQESDVDAARPYRDMLDGLAAEVRAHLMIAAQVLAELQPIRGRQASPERAREF